MLARLLLLLACDRPRLALAGAGVGVGALAADRQALAVAKPTVAGEVHQPLDVHRGFAAKVALDLMVAVDRFADLNDFLVGQVLDPALRCNAELCDDVLGRGAADSVDIGERDFHALVRRYVDPGNTCHSLSFFSSTGVEISEGESPREFDAYLLARLAPLQTKNRRAHECAAGEPVERDRVQIGFGKAEVKAAA